MSEIEALRALHRETRAPDSLLPTILSGLARRAGEVAYFRCAVCPAIAVFLPTNWLIDRDKVFCPRCQRRGYA